MTIVLILAGIIALFAFVESLFALGITGQDRTDYSGKPYDYTIVVAARNEQSSIENCIKSLLNQKYQPIKIIIVDDHSDDDTAVIVMKLAADNPLLQLVSCNSEENGKRAALLKGVLLATSDVILTTDADCIAGPDWAESMLQQLADHKKLITGPVVNKTNGSFTSAFEYAESLYLVSSGAGSASLGLMFQASGANMVFHRNDFVEFSKSGLGERYGCGDDVFFLQFIQKKYKGKVVGFNRDAASVIQTESGNSIKAWIRQRIRWAGKARGYKSVVSFIVGFFVLASSIAFATAIILAFINPDLRFYLWAIIGLKISGDLLLLITASIKWNIRIRLFPFFLLPLVYPLFVLVVATGVVFSRNKTWKGREIN